MRYALLLLAACSPDIAPGAYLCGAELSCPDGFACDAETTSCVIPSLAMPYTCISSDPTMATATAVPALTCGVNDVEEKACLTTGGEAWYAISVKPNCNVQPRAQIEIASPYAFAPLTAELRDATGATVIATATAGCPDIGGPEKTGEYAYCLSATLTTATSYFLRVFPTGDANCGGECNYNSYRVEITPSP